jgi:hypothetical protein
MLIASLSITWLRLIVTGFPLLHLSKNQAFFKKFIVTITAGMRIWGKLPEAQRKYKPVLNN